MALSLRRRSLAARLPLQIAAVLALGFAVMTAFVFAEVRISGIGTASERLEHAARQMADLLATSGRQRVAAVQLVAARSAAAGFLKAPDPARRSATLAALETQMGATPSVGVEVWDRAGRSVLAAGAAFPEMEDAEKHALLASALASAIGIVGPYQRTGRALTQITVIPMKDAAGAIGFLVERRPVNTSAASVALLTGLIGSSPTILVGNARGDCWTDLSRTVTGPPAAAQSVAGLVTYHRAGAAPAYARGADVPGTPWRVFVEFPQHTVLEPAYRFLRRAVLLSLVLIGCGAIAGWVVSHRITGPLEQVTAAAEAVAASRPAQLPELHRSDEIGRLANSFNDMAQQVEQSRVRLEALVQHLEKRVDERTSALQAANNELEAFSYSVSHDLRAPLRAIAGFARILEEDHAPHLTPEARRCIDVIERNARQMGLLIDDLLTFSRLGRHQQLSIAVVDMTALASSVADDVRGAEPRRSIEVVVHPLPAAQAEWPLVRQVYANLLQNAVKFSRSRDVATIEVGYQEDGGRPAYFVRDNGVGFDMAYAGKLFGVFQRLHPSDDFEGTGVGLAIVERIVRRHGGTVWAQSAVDAGATFFFTLPPAGDPS